MQPGLAGLDDRMAGIPAKAGHQNQRHAVHQFHQLQQQLVAGHVGQADVGDDHVEGHAVPDHQQGFAPSWAVSTTQP